MAAVADELTDGTKKFQRAKEPSVGPARRSSGTKRGKEGRGESNVVGVLSVARVLDAAYFVPRTQHSWRYYKKN